MKQSPNGSMMERAASTATVPTMPASADSGRRGVNGAGATLSEGFAAKTPRGPRHLGFGTLERAPHRLQAALQRCGARPCGSCASTLLGLGAAGAQLSMAERLAGVCTRWLRGDARAAAQGLRARGLVGRAGNGWLGA